MAWQLAEAKNKFSEVFTRTIEEGPQFITRRDQEIVLVAGDEFDRLTSEKSSSRHLLNIPHGDDPVLTQQPAYPREFEWGGI